MVLDLYKLERKMTKAQLWKDPYWLAKAVQKGRIKQVVVDKLPEMIEIMQQLYPDNWDISIVPTRTVTSTSGTNFYGGEWIVYKADWKIGLYPVIKIPDGTLTNGRRGQSTPMNGLYMRIPVSSRVFQVDDDLNVVEEDNSKLYFNRILEGVRDNITYEQYLKTYVHSHLNPAVYFTAADGGKFSAFCLGEGEIMQMFSMINNNWNKDLFRMILIHLTTIAYWESQEGVPYHHIEQIKNTENGIQDISEAVAASWAETIIGRNKVRPVEQHIKLNWRLINKYEIVEDEKFNEYTKFYGNNARDYDTNILVTKDSNGTYYAYNRNRTRSLPTCRGSIIFRGEEIPLRVVDTEPVIEVLPQFEMHPKIKQHVKQQLQYKANIQRIRQNAPRWLSQCSDARRSIT